jgi:hypothetical protein
LLGTGDLRCASFEYLTGERVQYFHGSARIGANVQLRWQFVDKARDPGIWSFGRKPTVF